MSCRDTKNVEFGSTESLGVRRRVGLILLFIAAPLVGSFFFRFANDPAGEAHVSLPIHAVLESQGGLACLTLAVLMLVTGAPERGTRSEAPLIIASSLILGGILDSFHAVLPAGNNFVWLRTCSTFGGGLLLSTLWWPAFANRLRTLPKLSLLGGVLVGAISLAMPDWVPMLLQHDSFTVTAKMMNLLGGLGYLAGAFALLRRGQSASPAPILLISTFCLFGAAGLLFTTSSLWKMDWWWWHGVRYVASLILLGESATHARKLYRRIFEERADLENAVQERTAELTSSNSKLRKTADDLGLFRTMLDKASNAIYLLDEDSRFHYANASAVAMFGYSREELFRQSITTINPDFPMEVWKANWQALQALPAGEFQLLETRHRRPDGRVHPVEVAVHLIRHEGRDYVLAIAIDISERVRVQAELRRSAQLADQALDLAHCGYWTVPFDGSGTYKSSERATAILGDLRNPECRYTLDHWRACMEAADPATAATAFEAYTKACEGKTPVYDATYPYKRPADGRIVWIHHLGVVTHDPAQPHPEMRGVVQDVTETVEARRELEAAGRLAEQANQMKSEFLANMSHEIRTPMNAILGYAQLMRHDPALPQEQLARVEPINRAGEHLLSLINDILEMSKIEAGKIILNESAFDLHVMLDDLVGIYGTRAGAKGLTLELERTPGVPKHILSDKGKLRQALINLLGNAVKFTRQGSITLVVDAKPVNHEAVMLRFVVADTGPGLGPDELKTLFKPFVQGSAGVSLGGTGLGLAISRQYARFLGGDIVVETEVGRGATFTLTVCAHLAEEDAVAAPIEAPHVLRLAEPHAPVRVLVADDNALSLELLKSIMGPMGFELKFASNGEEAVKLFDDWNPHAVLMDMRMPGMDGYEANRRIKATPEGQACFILALTASAFEEDKAAVLASGADDFMRRPFNQDALLAVLGQRLNLRYVYSDAVPAAPAMPSANLSRIPATLRLSLQEACARADFEQLVILCKEIAATGDNSSAAAVRERVYAFDYEGLARLLAT